MYLPLILLVPISNNDARDIHPGLFLNYPDECKSAIEADVWSVTLPKPPMKIKAQKPFKNDIKPGPVNEEMLLTDLFAVEAKVEDLIKGAVSRQSSSFCLILPITRPQSLWNLK